MWKCLVAALVPALWLIGEVAWANESSDAAGDLTATSLIQRLAAGEDDMAVAMAAGCPDVDSLLSHMGLAPEEFLRVEAAFTVPEVGARNQLVTPLAVESRGLRPQMPLLPNSFGSFAMGGVTVRAIPLGGSGRDYRDRFAGPTFIGTSDVFANPLGDPFGDDPFGQYPVNLFARDE